MDGAAKGDPESTGEMTWMRIPGGAGKEFLEILRGGSWPAVEQYRLNKNKNVNSIMF